MKKNIVVVVVLVLIVVGIGALVFIAGGSSSKAPSILPTSATSTPGVYNDTTAGFSFKYPLDATVQNTTDQNDGGAGNTTLIVKAKSGEEIQVTVSPFDENISLTADRIKKDIPTMVMKNTKTVQEGVASGALGTAVQAVYFETATTREVWFVTASNLYQVSGLLSDPRATFDSISTSFTF